MIIRKAQRSDIGFLANLILLSESTGHELYSYSYLFEKEDSELRTILERVLDNDFEGHGLTYKNFYVAEIDGDLVGGLSFYEEGVNGDSNHLMTGALMQVINRNELINSFAKLKDFRDIDIPKKQGTYQLDSVAVLSRFQGKGVFGAIMAYLENAIELKGKCIEVQVWKTNENAIKAYEKYGFQIEKVLDKGNNGRILMIKKYNGK